VALGAVALGGVALGGVALAGCGERAGSGGEPAPAEPVPAEPAPTPAAAERSPAPTPAGLVPPAALAGALPERLGGFTVRGEAVQHAAPGLVPTSSASLAYADGERRASLRIVDAGRAPDLVAGFAAAQRIDVPAAPGEDELVPTGIAGRPALASWSPERGASEAQVLVARRFLLALTVTPASTPEEAVELLEGLPFERLEALAR
jgi:hypothetical protein